MKRGLKKLQKYKVVSRIVFQYRKLKYRNRFVDGTLRSEIITEAKKSIHPHFAMQDEKMIYHDLLKSFFNYGVSIDDFFMYEFWKMSALERQNYITDAESLAIWQAFNPPENDWIFRDKFETYQRFKQYYDRDVIKVVEETEFSTVRDFCEKYTMVFRKPLDGCSGFGCRIINTDKALDVNALFLERLQTPFILEPYLHQSSLLAALHPDSINTIRINTILSKTGVMVINAILRIGNNHSYVDNYHVGGIVAAIDVESGVIFSLPKDRWCNTYIHHPITHEKIVGFQIPNWNEILEFSQEIATIFPQNKLIGWDIAVTNKNKVIMVEGNVHPGFQMQQLALHRGLKNEYFMALKDIGAFTSAAN